MRFLAFLLLFSSTAFAQVEVGGNSDTVDRAKTTALSVQVDQLQKTIADLRKAMEIMKEEAKTQALIEVNKKINAADYAKLEDFEKRITKLEEEKPYFTVSPTLSSSKNQTFSYTAPKDGVATVVAKGSIFGLVAGNQVQALYVNNLLMDTVGQSVIGDNVGSRSFQLAGQTLVKKGQKYTFLVKSTGEVINSGKIIIMQP